MSTTHADSTVIVGTKRTAQDHIPHCGIWLANHSGGTSAWQVYVCGVSAYECICVRSGSSDTSASDLPHTSTYGTQKWLLKPHRKKTNQLEFPKSECGKVAKGMLENTGTERQRDTEQEVKH